MFSVEMLWSIVSMYVLILMAQPLLLRSTLYTCLSTTIYLSSPHWMSVHIYPHYNPYTWYNPRFIPLILCPVHICTIYFVLFCVHHFVHCISTAHQSLFTSSELCSTNKADCPRDGHIHHTVTSQTGNIVLFPADRWIF